MRLALLVVTFVAFTAWSVGIAIEHGSLGFLAMAAREPWGAQVLVDLSLLFVLVGWPWLHRDARAHGIRPWPYLVATVALGSIAVLAYLVHREIVRRRVGSPAPIRAE